MYSILNLQKNWVISPLFRLYQIVNLIIILFFIEVFLSIFHLFFLFLHYGDINAKFLRICLKALVFFLATYEYISFVTNLISILFWLFISAFRFILSYYLFLFHKVNSFIFSQQYCCDLIILIESLFVIEDQNFSSAIILFLSSIYTKTYLY